MEMSMQNLTKNLIAVIVLMGLAVPDEATAQEIDPARVVSEGVGTVYAPPSHVSFWLHFKLPSEDLESGLVAGRLSEEQFRSYLSGREFRAASIDVYPPAVLSLEEGTSQVSVELRFSMAGLVGGEIGTEKFGALCDAMKLLGKEFTCQVSGPHMILGEEAVVIQEAVQEAVRAAFTAASGAATALGSSLQAVQRISIRSVEWNAPPDTEASYPNIESVACTVRVSVTYLIGDE
jgi:uncharacterized protein YggE